MIRVDTDSPGGCVEWRGASELTHAYTSEQPGTPYGTPWRYRDGPRRDECRPSQCGLGGLLIPGLIGPGRLGLSIIPTAISTVKTGFHNA